MHNQIVRPPASSTRRFFFHMLGADASPLACALPCRHYHARAHPNRQQIEQEIEHGLAPTLAAIATRFINRVANFANQFSANFLQLVSAHEAHRLNLPSAGYMLWGIRAIKAFIPAAASGSQQCFPRQWRRHNSSFLASEHRLRKIVLIHRVNFAVSNAPSGIVR